MADENEEDNQQLSHLRFVKEPPHYLKCGLCEEVLTDPLMSFCGHSFCRPCVALGNAACPVHQTKLKLEEMFPNLTLKETIDHLQVYCQYAQFSEDPESGIVSLGSNGCQEIVQLGSKQVHEESCPHRPVLCPNHCSHGHHLSPLDLAEHLKYCSLSLCSNSPLGCSFKGLPHDLSVHSSDCMYSINLEAALSLDIQEVQELYLLAQAKYEQIGQRIERMSMAQEELMDRIAHLVSNKAEPPANRGLVFNKSPLVPNSPSRVAPSPDIERYEKLEEELLMPFYFRCKGFFRGHTGSIWTLNSYKNTLFSSGSDMLIKVWDMKQFDCVKTLYGHKGVVHALVVCKNYLISGDSVKTVNIWVLDSFELVGSFTCEDDICAMAAVGDYIFTASYATIRVWDLETQVCQSTTGGLDHWVRALCAAPDGSTVYAACHQRVLRWDPLSMKFEEIICAAYGSIPSLVVTPQYIICGTYNQNIHVYDSSTFLHVFELVDHLGMIRSMCLSVANEYLFSASEDSTIKIWSLKTRRKIQTLNRHTGSVNCLLRANGYLFSGGSDQTVKIFQSYKGFE